MKLRNLLLSLTIPAFALGCAVDSSNDEARVQRGPLGKADHFGSCMSVDDDFCGGKSNGSCWCDAKCHDYGDCCGDAVDVCGQEIGDVLPLCLGVNDCDGGQFCDFSECKSGCNGGEICPAVCFGVCEDGTDPCSVVKCASGTHCEADNGQAWCVPDTNACAAVLCGPGTHCEDNGGQASCIPDVLVKCNADLSCGASEYCHWDSNEQCGNDGGSGVCTPLPQACTKELDPVCGCDGEVYGNACEANFNGLSWVPAALSNEGYICPSIPDTTPGSCENQCGGSAGSCYCDDLCEQYGDCCGDYTSFCAA